MKRHILWTYKNIRKEKKKEVVQCPQHIEYLNNMGVSRGHNA